MGEIDLVFDYSRKIESILENNFGAQGRGLHDKLSSVEAQFPPALARKIRWIATIRNNMAHADDYRLEDAEDFKRTGDAVVSELKALAAKDLRLIPMEAAAEASEGYRWEAVRRGKTSRLLLAFVFALGFLSGMVAVWQMQTRGVDVLGRFSALYANVAYHAGEAGEEAKHFSRKLTNLQKGGN